MKFTKIMNEKVAETEAVINNLLPEEAGLQKRVFEAMNYSVLPAGSVCGPLMMKAAADMFGGRKEALLNPFMAAIEMIHTYSLVHDDLPTMDNDEYRTRKKDNPWKVYGEDMAILAGDGLLNFAYETAAKALETAKNAG